MGGGQMKAADFVMTAAVQVSDNNAGGMGGGWRFVEIRVRRGVGGVKFKDAGASVAPSAV